MKCIVCDIGNLRADHLGCYGYDRPVSPAIDALAARGLCCNAAFSSDVTNAGSRASLFSGRFGLEHSIVTDGMPSDSITGHTPLSEFGLSAPNPLLHEYLACHGQHTATISPFGRTAAPWFYTGWCEVNDPWIDRNPLDVKSEEIIDRAALWLEQNADKDFFLYLSLNDLYRDPDTPLSESEISYTSELALHGNQPHPDEDAVEQHFSLHAAYSPRIHHLATRDALAHFVNMYDARIRSVDSAIARLCSGLDTLGIFEECIICIVSDHGVLLGECGCYGGHISAHYRCANIPFIIYAPKNISTQRLHGYCYTFDLGPTLCELLGIPIPTGYHGISLLKLLEADLTGGRDYIVCSHGHFTAQRTIISGGWKLNRTLHSGFWDFDDTELYNIADDPAERINCAKKQPDIILDLNRKLRQWLNEYQPDYADPLARIACQEPPGYLKFGQELRARVRRGELSVPAGYRGRWA